MKKLYVTSTDQRGRELRPDRSLVKLIISCHFRYDTRPTHDLEDGTGKSLPSMVYSLHWWTLVVHHSSDSMYLYKTLYSTVHHLFSPFFVSLLWQVYEYNPFSKFERHGVENFDSLLLLLLSRREHTNNVPNLINYKCSESHHEMCTIQDAQSAMIKE